MSKLIKHNYASHSNVNYYMTSCLVTYIIVPSSLLGLSFIVKDKTNNVASLKLYNCICFICDVTQQVHI